MPLCQMQFSQINSGVYSLSCFGKNVLAAFSGREFDNLHHSDFLNHLGIAPESLIRPKQVHGKNVIRIKGGESKSVRCEGDALVTNVSGATLGILTADCVPVFFEDRDKRAVGLAHAGWRGIEKGVIAETIQSLQDNFSSVPGSLRIAIGPAIRECCYEVGREFKDIFPRYYFERKDTNQAAGFLDLIAAVKGELERQGIQSTQVYDTGICTSCQNTRFFSFRREKGTPERILSLIQVRPAQS